MPRALSFLKPLKYAVLFGACLSSSSVFAQEKLELVHSVYLGGLFLGRISTQIDQSESAYKISSHAETSDTLSWLVSWLADGRSYGVVRNNIFSPQQHVHESAWRKKKRGAIINYSSDGLVSYEQLGKPTNNPKKYTPILPSSLHKSFDPMSMILQAGMEMSDGKPCQGEYPVFDGRRRYDVLLSNGDERTFSPSVYSVFSGKAKGCKIDVVKKGGFKRNSDYELNEGEDLILWVASPAEGARVVPVRMEVDTDLGAMELHLERYSEGEIQLISKKAQ
ncbi:MAG: DUF3108 domain-containing protein [Sneathiella sp.]